MAPRQENKARFYDAEFVYMLEHMMKGEEYFRHGKDGTVEKIPAVANKSGLTREDVQWVLDQAPNETALAGKQQGIIVTMMQRVDSLDSLNLVLGSYLHGNQDFAYNKQGITAKMSESALGNSTATRFDNSEANEIVSQGALPKIKSKDSPQFPPRA